MTQRSAMERCVDYCVHPRDADATNGQGDEAAIEEAKKSGSHRGRERRRGVEGAV